MKDTRFIKTIRLRNLLSFGPESEEIELKPLNVLIGPNASGKSNFIDAISILQAAPRDISTPFREGGGIREWIWKGEGEGKFVEIKAKLLLQHDIILRYIIVFSCYKDHLLISTEDIENEKRPKKEIYLDQKRKIQDFKSSNDYNMEQSILNQFKDPFSLPELNLLGNMFGKIKLYRDWHIGTYSTIRKPQQTDLPSGFLLESFTNFSMILNDLKDRRETKDLINEKLKQFYNEFDYITIEIKGGTAQLLIYEKGLKDPIPATRLSDGTLRYLCLLMILCHPEPPPLICIEEPEIGLHPDIMPTIADLLIEASKRTQLIVTTHSDILVSALSETPESVLVCEHDEAGSHLRRLDEKKLKVWLKDYSLGELWLKGEIGGNRW